jgi:hypothetical protein
MKSMIHAKEAKLSYWQQFENALGLLRGTGSW